MLNNRHLSELVYRQAEKYGDRAALSWRDYEANTWRDVSWREFARLAHRVSTALLKAGVKVQENVAVFSQNKPECLYVDFGAYALRAVTIPFYATSSGSQVAYMVNDAAVRYLFVGEQDQYDTAMSVVSVCPTLEHIVIFDRNVRRREGDEFSVYFDDFLDEAADQEEQLSAEIDARLAAASYDDTANILYTSGTTGNSKGVILTYGMYHEGFRVNDACLPLDDRDVILCFLPFTHVFERAWSYLCLCEGARLAVNLRPQDVLRSLQEVHPSCMSSVPRFWEKVYQGVQERMETTSAVERALIHGALSVGERCWTEYLSKGKPLPAILRMRYAFYQRTVVKKLRRTLGLENANFFPTAGAAVAPEVEKFVHAAGIYMVVGYGLTESTATVSCDHPGEANSLGSVGRIVDKLEIKFGENDEILLRGKTITPGYYRKEAATADAIDADGWFHTGDSGFMRDGQLFLKERIKDLFKTSNGKYIAPQMIEAKLVVDKLIDQAVIVADKHKFVSALIVPDYATLRHAAEAKGISVGEGNEALCANADVKKIVEERIELLQQDLAHYEKVKHFILLSHPLTIASGELTNTLKVKRRVVYERYAPQIEALYAEAEKQHAANR